MSALPMIQVFELGAKLATTAGCGMALQHIDRPALGILAGAALLIPLAWSLEDLLQLSVGWRNAKNRGPASGLAATKYRPISGMAHSAMGR